MSQRYVDPTPPMSGQTGGAVPAEPKPPSNANYKLAAVVLVSNLAMTLLAVVVMAWVAPESLRDSLDLFALISGVVDLALSFAVWRGNSGARTWVIIRTAVGMFFGVILIFVGEGTVGERLLQAIMQFAYCGTLLLLLVGTPGRWRTIGAAALGLAGYIGPTMILIALVAVSPLLPDPTSALDSKDDQVTPMPGTTHKVEGVKYGRFEHCDADGCFAVELPTNWMSESDDSLTCGADEWVLSAMLLADRGVGGEHLPSMETLLDTALESWLESDYAVSFSDEDRAIRDDSLLYAATCTHSDGDTGQCRVYAESESGVIKLVWLVDYERRIDGAAMFDHAVETFEVTEYPESTLVQPTATSPVGLPPVRATRTPEPSEGPTPMATAMPGTTYRKEGIVFGRYEHCDADGCVAVDLPVVGAEDAEGCLWAMDLEHEAWIMSVTLLALEPEVLEMDRLFDSALETCIDFWMEAELVTSYEIVESDVTANSALYRLETTDDWGDSVAYVYYETTDTQIVELAIVGEQDSEIRVVFEQGCDTFEITVEPDASAEGWSASDSPEAALTPMPGTTYEQDGIVYGRYEHCDEDGCLAMDLPIVGADETEGSLWCYGEWDDDSAMQATLFAFEPEFLQVEGLFEGALEVCIASWLDADVVDTYELVDSDTQAESATYRLAITDEWGDGVAYVHYRVTEIHLIELWAIGRADSPTSPDMEAIFDRAHDTLEITRGPIEPAGGWSPRDSPETEITPLPGSLVEKDGVTYGRYEHCDPDGCFAIEMPTGIAAEDEDSLYCQQEDWVMAAFIIEADDALVDGLETLEYSRDLIIENWTATGLVEDVVSETTSKREGYIRYSADIEDSFGSVGRGYIRADVQDGRVKLLWAVDYDDSADHSSEFDHAWDCFQVTE